MLSVGEETQIQVLDRKKSMLSLKSREVEWAAPEQVDRSGIFGLSHPARAIYVSQWALRSRPVEQQSFDV